MAMTGTSIKAERRGAWQLYYHGCQTLFQRAVKPNEANAKLLSILSRVHWGIENRVHYVRDVTFGEDGCRVRKGSAPQVLSAVRSALIHILAGIDASSNAAAIRRLNARPEEALALLDLPQIL